jgi:outer membrane protein assembly factor BamB
MKVNVTRITDHRLGFARVLGTMLLAGLGVWSQARADDWPQFLGPTRNGISLEVGLLQSWPKDGPKVAWQKDVGRGFSGPAVAGGRLILFHRLGEEEMVECLNATTGKLLWRFAYPTEYVDDFGMDDGPRATPLIADKRVYTLGAEGRLHCLELETGKKIWDRSLNSDYQARKGFFGVGTSPLLEGNLLLVNVGGTEAGIVGFSKDSGKEVWRATHHEASYSSPVVATFNGRRLAIFLTREGIVFLDPLTGNVKHSQRFRAAIHSSVNAATPVVANDCVFFSALYGTGALALRVHKDRFEQLWKNNDSLSCHYSTAIHHDGFIYGIDGGLEGDAQLRCVELTTGRIRWGKDRFGRASMILAEGRLVCLNEHGELLLVEANPGAYQEKARAALLLTPCRSQPALADGLLYARDPKKLVCWYFKRAQ